MKKINLMEGELYLDETTFVRSLEDQLCFEVYKASNGFSRMYGRALKSFGITFPQYLVLLALWDEDHIFIKNISDRLGMSIGTLNPILNRLTAQGWIQKVASDSDKRAVVVTLTEKSQQSKKAISKAILNEIIQCDLTDVGNEAFKRGLKSLNNEFNSLEEKNDLKN